MQLVSDAASFLTAVARRDLFTLCCGKPQAKFLTTWWHMAE